MPRHAAAAGFRRHACRRFRRHYAAITPAPRRQYYATLSPMAFRFQLRIRRFAFIACRCLYAITIAAMPFSPASPADMLSFCHCFVYFHIFILRRYARCWLMPAASCHAADTPAIAYAASPLTPLPLSRQFAITEPLLIIIFSPLIIFGFRAIFDRLFASASHAVRHYRDSPSFQPPFSH